MSEKKKKLDCQEKMAYFMIQRYVNIINELPKNEVHRVLKRVLKKDGVTETTFDREKEGYKIECD